MEPNIIQQTLDLSYDEARSLTDQIKATADTIWSLLEQAHKGRAWKVLGYLTWEAYVRTEFDMSRRRSYQVLDQAKVIHAVEEIVGEDLCKNLHISSEVARDLKPVIHDVTAQISERIQNMPTEQVEEIVVQVIHEQRSQIQKAEAFRQGREDAARLRDIVKPPPPDDQEKVRTSYILFRALEELQRLPEPSSPMLRVDSFERHYVDMIPNTIEWLQRFMEAHQ